MSTDCLGCGGSKKRRMSFCAPCFRSLPPMAKNALYRKDGYPETFETTLRYLEKQKGKN
ncbi:hypothetical protein [Verrucomicrobium spinosum]|nr:hypothetical protein [Verrucomicrobium spinosum]